MDIMIRMYLLCYAGDKKNNKNISKRPLLKILPGMLSVEQFNLLKREAGIRSHRKTFIMKGDKDRENQTGGQKTEKPI